jgi:hypothetical protein
MIASLRVRGNCKGATNMQTTAQQGWHTAQWGTWGWLETIVKSIALFIGFIAFFSTPMTGITLSGNPHLAALIVLALLTLGTVGQLVIRWQQREIISFIFAIFHFLGHAALLIALAQVPHDRLWPLLFGIFYTIGTLLKIQFLRITGYTESGATSSLMIGSTVGVLVLNVLFTVFMLPA